MNLQTRRATLVVGIIVAAAFAAGRPTLAQALKDDPLIGNWTLNRVKSSFNPDGTVDGRTMKFEVVRDGIRHTMLTKRIGGGNFEGLEPVEYTFKYDGKDVPVSGSALGTVSIERIDKNTIERTAKVQGQVVETQTWSLSADGKTLTLTTSGNLGGGNEYSNIQAFERQ